MKIWETIDPNTKTQAIMMGYRGAAIIATLVFAHTIIIHFSLSNYAIQVVHGIELVLIMLLSLRTKGNTFKKIAFALGLLAFTLLPIRMIYFQVFGSPFQKQIIACVRQFDASHLPTTSPEDLRQQRKYFVRACMQNQRSTSD